MPGENIWDWSTTAADNANADSSINWAEGMARAVVNNSARSEMAAYAKLRDLQNGTVVTTGLPNQQAFASGMDFTEVPTGMRVLLKIGTDLTNTGSVTLALDTTAPVTIKRHNGNELSGSEMRSGGLAELVYNGSNWILLRETATGFNEPPPPISGGGEPPPPAPTPAGPDLISTTIASASDTVHITGLNSSYDEYVVLLTNVVGSTVNTKFILRAQIGGTGPYIDGASDYSWVSSFQSSTGPSITPLGDFNDSEIELTNTSAPDIGGFPISGEVRIFSPWRAISCNILWTVCYQNGNQTGYIRIDGGGRVNPATAVTALEFAFLPASGLNTIESGTFQLYGIRK